MLFEEFKQLVPDCTHQEFDAIHRAYMSHFPMTKDQAATLLRNARIAALVLAGFPELVTTVSTEQARIAAITMSTGGKDA